MITLDEHIDNFGKLSDFLSAFILGKTNPEYHVPKCLAEAVDNSMIHNGYFTKQNIFLALNSIAIMLEKDKIKKWIHHYEPLFKTTSNPCKVGVVLAGNIPIVGFHDFLCVLVSGNIFMGKLSQNDRYLLPAIAEVLSAIDNRYKDLIYFTENKLEGFDAVIATGSNNTSRYFEYYFGKYPHIIRKNRNSIAVLAGNETDDQLTLLAADIFSYFGLGCRNVSKIYIPESFDLQRFIDAMKPFSFILDHHKYKNNYDYYKTIFIMDKRIIIDGGFFLLVEDPSMYSPVSVINFERYSDINSVQTFLQEHSDSIQCIVGSSSIDTAAVPFGKAQHPELWNYADNSDTMNFLLTL
ncbi:MAG TPA: acyl-CoA reductase [Bacteroidales bacterium]|nr:acyl-CoA reductase [Bacteroidales bacterium]